MKSDNEKLKDLSDLAGKMKDEFVEKAEQGDERALIGRRRGHRIDTSEEGVEVLLGGSIQAILLRYDIVKGFCPRMNSCHI